MTELLLELQAELQELAVIEAESIGWLPLGDGAYLDLGKPLLLCQQLTSSEPEEAVFEEVGTICPNRFSLGSINSKERRQ